MTKKLAVLSGIVGRPAIIDDIVLQKLETAFANGCTDKEACLFAKVGQSTLYAYQKEHPEFQERKSLLKETPVLKARGKVVKDIDENVETAKWYLERKCKKEFGKDENISIPIQINFNEEVKKWAE